MNTKQIDYCIELAHTLNFSRAAENLFVSQPSFSYQIRLLEEEVGFAIFERSGKGASLTPAGSQFVGFLSGMREDLKRAIEQGQNFSAKYKDSITISLLVRQAVYCLPEAMRLFAVSHPDVQHRLISSGRIDYFNSADHDTTLTNVAAGKGICLAPGFLNDHSGQFAWIPFDCSEMVRLKVVLLYPVLL